MFLHCFTSCAAIKDEAEAPEKLAKEKHEKAWEGGFEEKGSVYVICSFAHFAQLLCAEVFYM